MFDRFFSKKNIDTQRPIPDEKKMNTPKTTENGDVKVFVWPGGFFDGLGHVGLQLNGEKPKYSASDPGEYVSIWPKSTAAGGLTAILPLEPTFCKNLGDDCIQEARRAPQDFSNLMEQIEPIPIEPTVHTINNLDKEKMRKELSRIETGIAKGEIFYQLLPGVKTSRFFNTFWPETENQKQEVYNCVTLTQHLLKEGGLTGLPESPWTTPSKLGSILTAQSTSNNNSINAQENSTSFCQRSY